MTAVAVTGASGEVGSRLLEVLEGAEGVRRVVAVDTAPCPVSTKNMELYRMDVRSPALVDVFSSCDALVHLASSTAMRDPDGMRDVNVEGTRNALTAAADAGVPSVVVVSSAVAYGAHPDNEVPLTEASGLRPVPEFAYSAHKVEVEELVAAFAQRHPQMRITVLRPALVCGPAVSGPAARLVGSSSLISVEGYSPPLQFVHSDDLVQAIVFAVQRELTGIYNVCSSGWLSLDEVAGLLGKRHVSMPYDRARRRAELLWRLHLWELPPSCLPFLMYPWVMSNDSLQEAGFVFEHTNESALLAAAQAHRSTVAVGPVHLTPRSAAVLGGAIAITGSIAARELLRRLDRHRT